MNFINWTVEELKVTEVGPDCVPNIEASVNGAVTKYDHFEPRQFREIVDELKYRLNRNEYQPLPEIKDVIYNGPATIVLWCDDTKTVVKCCEDDFYDPEKGLAMAICEKVLGSKANLHRTFKKWVVEPEEVDLPKTDEYIRKRWSLPSIDDAVEYVTKTMEALYAKD